MLPSFLTSRLHLRPADLHDADQLWRIWADPDVRRFLFDDEPVTRERAVDVLTHCLSAANSGLGLWIVTLRGTNDLIGCVGLMTASTAAEYDPSLTGAVEPIASFNPAVWRRGYAAEALAALIHYAFATLRLHRLAAVIDAPNEASHCLTRRLGFTPVRECDGARYRLRVYSLTAESFPPPQAE